jgi:MFS family permease
VPRDDSKTIHEHFVRGMGESARHNSLAYGYSLALSGTFGVLNLQDRTSVLNIVLFGLGGSLAFTVANPLVTRGFQYRVEGERPIVLSIGTSLGFLSVTASIGLAALVGWLFGSWVAWFVGAFVASGAYLVLSACQFVLGRYARTLLGRDRLRER